MRTTEFSTALRRLSKGDTAVREYDVREYRKVKALNQHYGIEHFRARQMLLVCPNTCDAEKVLVIACIEPLPEK